MLIILLHCLNMNRHLAYRSFRIYLTWHHSLKVPLSPSEFSFVNVCALAHCRHQYCYYLNLFSAASRSHPKLSCSIFDSFKYPALARRDWSLATCSFWSPSTSPFALHHLKADDCSCGGPRYKVVFWLECSYGKLRIATVVTVRAWCIRAKQLFCIAWNPPHCAHQWKRICFYLVWNSKFMVSLPTYRPQRADLFAEACVLLSFIICICCYLQMPGNRFV